MFGIYLCYFAAAPYSPSAAQLQQYDSKMELVSAKDNELAELQGRLAQARAELEHVKVFMWSWRMPYKELVPPRQHVYNQLMKEYRKLQKEQDKLARAAKSELGLWSDFGVTDTREAFWYVNDA